MFKNLKNIDSAFKLTKYISYILAFSMLIISGVFMILNYKNNLVAKNTIYILNKNTGEVFSATADNKNKYKKIEIKANALLFINYFFNIDPTNYATRNNRALRMGNSSIASMVKSLQKKGWYEDIQQYNIFQYSKLLDIKINTEVFPYKVNCIINLSAKADLEQASFSKNVEIEFWMKDIIDRTDDCPYGLYIEKIILKKVD